MTKSSQPSDVGTPQPPASVSSPPGSHERPAQRPYSAAPFSLAAQILQRHAQLGRMNHFEQLELPEHADQEMIRRAFRQLVLRFHPDRLEGPDEQLRPLAKDIICRLGTAFRVLDDATTRNAYRQSLRDYAPLSAARSSIPAARSSIPAARSSIPAARSSIPAARSSIPARPSNPPLRPSGASKARGSLPPFRPSQMELPGAPSITSLAAADWTPERAFEAAKIQLARGRKEEAFALVESACVAEPERPEFRALLAWLRADRGELQGASATEILDTLTWAVRERRTDLEIRLYRGRVLKLLGKMDEAIRDFSVIASMDERNLEAVREVRLHRAREEQKASTSGLFKAFFK